MNIVYVTGLFAQKNEDVLGGMPRYIYKIGVLMQERGHNINILTTGHKDRVWNYQGIEVHTICYTPICSENRFVKYVLNPMKRDILFNNALKSMNQKRKIDLVQYAGWFGVGILYNRKMPSVLRISTYSRVQLSTEYSKQELNIMSWSERMAARNFDAIFAPSKVTAQVFSADVNRKVSVIRTPFVIDLSEEEEDQSVWERKLEEKKYFLFFGRISKDKGVVTIAKCIYKFLQNYPDCYFVFAGNVAYGINGFNSLKLVKRMAREYNDRIIYLGQLEHKQLYPIIRKSIGVVMPSIMDNLPNSCLEALYLNGIVIGTRKSSLDEIIRNQISGLLIEIDNERQLLTCMSNVMEMKEDERKRMKENAIKELERFEAKRLAKQLEKYYEKIIIAFRKSKRIL